MRRPISIHSVKGITDLEILYAVPVNVDQTGNNVKLMRKTEISGPTGIGTRWLSNLKEGSMLDILGPLGNGFTIEASANKLLLIAGGIGIAPLKYLADFALAQHKQVTLLLGARTKCGVFPSDRLPSNMDLIVATEDGTAGEKQTIVELAPKYIAWADQIFSCGPVAMYKALAAQMNSWPADKPVQISLEARMGCGAGTCYSCSIKTKQGVKRVCKEGPVFNIKDIIWQEVRI